MAKASPSYTESERLRAKNVAEMERQSGVRKLVAPWKHSGNVLGVLKGGKPSRGTPKDKRLEENDD